MFPHLLIPVMLSAISIDNRIKLIEEFRKADAVILTYACDQPSTLDRLTSYWLPELRRLEVCDLLVKLVNIFILLLCK